MLSEITPGDIESWHSRILAEKGPGVVRLHYVMLRACLNAAVKNKRLSENPCQIRGASKHTVVPQPKTTQQHGRLFSSNTADKSLTKHRNAMVRGSG